MTMPPARTPEWTEPGSSSRMASENWPLVVVMVEAKPAKITPPRGVIGAPL
ncbi:hypothetical protein D3C87_2191410 [compost metagenome]